MALPADAVLRPSRAVLSGGAYEAIRRMILAHEISPGEHISIDGLARALDVSQTPVREALARLESDELVVKVPLRGYEATDLLTMRQFGDLFQFRMVIEPWSAEHAALRGVPEEVEALAAEVRSAETIADTDRRAAYARFTDHDTRFHTLVARMSGNSHIEEAYARTHCHLHLFRVYTATIDRHGQDPEDEFVEDLFAEYYRSPGGSLAITEHREIVNAIAARDGERARTLMLHHIESSRRRFVPAVEALNS